MHDCEQMSINVETNTRYIITTALVILDTRQPYDSHLKYYRSGHSRVEIPVVPSVALMRTEVNNS